jgi:transposase-like protein
LAQLLHGSATTTTTTTRTGAEVQSSEESVAALARRHGVNPKTVAKWRKRDGVDDSPGTT